MPRPLPALTALVLLLLLTVSSCAKPAAFEVSNLTVTPQEVQTDQPATVSVEVANTGAAEGTYTVILTLDGVQAEQQQVTVGPRATQRATFSVTREQAGSCAVDVNGLRATLMVKEPPPVLKPAEFELANLVIEPGEVTSGGSSEISVEVTNIGEEAGDYEVVLTVDGQIVESRKLSVDAGETETVSFGLTEEPGTHAVDVNGLTATLVVDEPPKPARFTVSGLTVSPDWVATGESVTVSVDVRNTGEVRGEHQVVLKVDNQVAETKTVALAAGATTTVHFTLTAGDERTYTVTVSYTTATFVVGDRLVRFSAPIGFKPFNLVNVLMDFDSDGDLDLVAVQYYWPPAPSEVLAFRNDGHGNFTEATADVFGGTTILATQAGQWAVADFNSDGRDDLFIVDSGPDPPELQTGAQNLILIQNADGQLIDETATRLPQRMEFTHGTTAGDIDNDGDMDIYVCNHEIRGEPQVGGVYFCINDGSGFFQSSTAGLPSAVANMERAYTASLLLDVDKDGDLDLVLGHKPMSGRERDAILLNDGLGNFSFAPETSMPPRPGGPDACTVYISSADMDKDGWPDLVMSTHKWEHGPSYRSYDPALQLLLNNGDGTFRDESARVEQNWPEWELPFDYRFRLAKWPRIIDSNGDGWLDILAVGDGFCVPHILFESVGGERFEFSQNISLDYRQHYVGDFYFYPVIVIPGDVDSNGVIDFVLLYPVPDQITLEQQVLLRK